MVMVLWCRVKSAEYKADVVDEAKSGSWMMIIKGRMDWVIYHCSGLSSSPLSVLTTTAATPSWLIAATTRAR